MDPPTCGQMRCRMHRYPIEFQTRLVERMFVPYLEGHLTVGELAHLLTLHEKIVQNG